MKHFRGVSTLIQKLQKYLNLYTKIVQSQPVQDLAFKQTTNSTDH